jgi:hypothetical protein
MAAVFLVVRFDAVSLYYGVKLIGRQKQEAACENQFFGCEQQVYGVNLAISA